MVHVLRCVRDFFEKPYNSIDPQEHPCGGGALQDFMVGHGIGFAKSLAMKILPLGVNHLELSDDELKALSPQVKALYGFRCTYKTAGQERQDRFACLQDKFAESARPRPLHPGLQPPAGPGARGWNGLGRGCAEAGG